MGPYSTSHLLQGPRPLSKDYQEISQHQWKVTLRLRKRVSGNSLICTPYKRVSRAFVVAVAVVSLSYRVLTSLGVAVQMVASDGWYNNSAVKDLV